MDGGMCVVYELVSQPAPLARLEWTTYMTRPSEPAHDLTSYTLRDVPDALWERWQKLIPRKYSRLGDAILELIAADVHCREEHGRGAVELLVDEDVVTTDEVESILEQPADAEDTDSQ